MFSTSQLNPPPLSPTLCLHSLLGQGMVTFFKYHYHYSMFQKHVSFVSFSNDLSGNSVDQGQECGCLRNFVFDVTIYCLCTHFVGVRNSNSMYGRVISTWIIDCGFTINKSSSILK
jgi:hypothetical protein